MMRTKAPVAVLIALACLQLSGVTLFAAKPTRSVTRHSEGRLIVAQPTQRLSRERCARRRANVRQDKHVRPHSTAVRVAVSAQPVALNLSRYAGPTAPHSIATRRAYTPALVSNSEADSVHAWMHTHDEQQRSLAAQTANAAADQGIRSVRAVQVDRGDARTSLPATPATGATPAVLRNPAASRQSAEAAASGDGPVPGNSTLLINIGGVLRPISETHPLPSIEEEAATPVILPALRVSALYDNRGHLMVPLPLYGSHDILIHQNQMADLDGLDRVRDDADLLALRRQHKLVALPESEALRIDDRLPEDRRFSRPWTADFLAALARDHYDSFHMPLQVNSAVRTVEFQQRLTHSNANAAPSTGDTASPHLTGQAVDIAKHGLSITEIAWMRAYLQPLIDQGKIDVEEEFQQACFHISVYKNYAPGTPAHVTLAVAR
jgi:hypothetical protein